MKRKVPEITLLFWVIKLLTTAMGESTSDFFVFKINPYVAVSLGFIALVLALVLQFSAKRYFAGVYWFTAAMVAVFGTMMADVLHVQLGISYAVSTVFFAVVLAVVFVAWQKSEGTLSIHSINSRQRELFYWATVLATFALGTAAGDLAANTLGLGYFSSGLVFLGLIALPAIGHWVFKLNEIATFWTAYVLTRPLGASFADWAGKPKTVSGLGWGDGHVSLALTILLIIFVSYAAFNRQEAKRETRPPAFLP